MAREWAIRTEGLTKRFGRVTAVQGLGLAVEPGAAGDHAPRLGDRRDRG